MSCCLFSLEVTVYMFFRSYCSEFQETVDAISSQHSIEKEDERGSKELEDISKIDMTFRRELNYLGRTFLLPKKGELNYLIYVLES